MGDGDRDAPVTRRLIIASMLSGFAAGLDATSSFIVFPAIRSDLANGDTASASWVLTIAGIVSAAVLLQAGRLADRFGHDRILITSAVGLAAASLASTLAPTLALLVAARGLQAAALAGMSVSSIAILVRETPTDRLSTRLGTWGLWTATSGVVGPVLAAGLVEAATWRLMFAATIPFSIAIALLAAPAWRIEHTRVQRGVIDYLGTAMAMAGLSLLVLALLEGGDWGWGSGRTIGSLVGGWLLLVGVIARSRVHPDPIVPLYVFGLPDFRLSLLIGFVSQIMFFAMWLALLSYATDVWGHGLVRTGLLLTVMPGTMMVISAAMGRTADERGARLVMATGSIIFTVGFAFAALRLGEAPNTWLLVPVVIGAGIGMAAVVPINTSVATRSLAPDIVGTGTAIFQTTTRVGAAFGSALVVTLLETGTIGDAATHRRPIWLIVGCGALCAVLSARIRPLAAKR